MIDLALRPEREPRPFFTLLPLLLRSPAIFFLLEIQAKINGKLVDHRDRLRFVKLGWIGFDGGGGDSGLWRVLQQRRRDEIPHSEKIEEAEGAPIAVGE